MIERILAAMRLLSAASKRAGEDTAEEVNRELQRLSRLIWGLIAEGTNPRGPAVLDQSQVEVINTQIDDALRDHAAAVRRVFREGFAAQAEIVNVNTEAIYAVVGRTDLEAIRSARAVFVTEARQMMDRRARVWMERFRGDSQRLKSQMQVAFNDAIVLGWDQRTLAGELTRLPEFTTENLPSLTERGRRQFSMSGSLSESDALLRRAHVIARTEMNTISNTMHRAWTQAAGREWFVNLNTEPVATECKEANEQPPMVWDDWVRWKASNGRGGVPSRHPQCDSRLLGMTQDVARQLANNQLVGV